MFGAIVLGLSACTGTRDAVPLAQQISFLPLAEGEQYPLLLGEWARANVGDIVEVRFEPRYSPSLPPVDLAVIESSDLARMRRALAGELTSPPPPPQPSNMKLLFEAVPTRPDPGGGPSTRWRAHVVRSDQGFETEGATASVKFPSRKDDFGGVQIFLSDPDASKFHALTEKYNGGRIAITLGERALSVPVVNEPIPGGEVMITTGGASADERATESKALFRELTGT